MARQGGALAFSDGLTYGCAVGLAGAIVARMRWRRDALSDARSSATTTFTNELAGGASISYCVEAPPAHLYHAAWAGQTNIARGGFAAITEEHVARYATLGFLIVEDAFSSAEVAAALDAVDLYCSERDTPFAAAAAACTATAVDAREGHDGPGVQFEASAAALPRGERGAHVRKLKSFHEFDERLRRLSADGSALRREVGRVLFGTPVGTPAGADAGADSGAGDGLEVFQSTALLKPPGGREKPWHQDHAYFNLPIRQSTSGAPTDVVGAWLALDPADEGNGCMFVQPGQQRPSVHWQRRDWQLCDDVVTAGGARDVLAVPLRPGSLLLFSSLLPHGTPPNLSRRRRRALQWHFVPRGAPRVTDAARHAVFGSEGKAVEC